MPHSHAFMRERGNPCVSTKKYPRILRGVFLDIKKTAGDSAVLVFLSNKLFFA